jgi:hypothetical protein
MTFIAYPNITAISENGRFRLEVVGSPSEDFFRNQDSFIYRMYDGDRQAWEISAPDLEETLADYPHEAWVSDQGWAVVRTHAWFFASLLVFSPEGRVVLNRLHRSGPSVKAGPGFLDGEPENYMGDSSAGPFWARSAIAYFAEYGGRPYWCIRTWWGKRVVVDLEGADIVGSEVLPEPVMRERECRWIESSLANNVSRLETDGQRLSEMEDDSEYWLLAKPIMAAAYHAGWLRSKAAIPFLRRLEACPLRGGFAFIEWDTVYRLIFRQVARLSLLRMELEPRWIPLHEFEANDVLVELSAERPRGEAIERLVERQKLDLSPRSMLQEYGAPDFVQRGEWDYDIFSKSKASTLRVFWDASHLDKGSSKDRKKLALETPPRMARAEVLDPQWKSITMRDYHVLVD